MKTIQDVLKGFATRAGLADRDEIKPLLESPALAQIAVPDNAAPLFTSALEEGLVTIEQAKAHEGLNKHFKQSVLSQAEEQFIKLAEQDDVLKAHLDELRKTETLGNKTAKALKLYRESRVSDPSKVGEQTKAEIQRLQTELEQARRGTEGYEAKLKEQEQAFQQQLRGTRIEAVLTSELGKRKYAIDAVQANPAAYLKGTLEAKLKSQGWEIDLDPSGSPVVVKNLDGKATPALGKMGKPVSLGEIIDEVAAPFLAKAAPSGSPAGGEGRGAGAPALSAKAAESLRKAQERRRQLMGDN